MSDGFRLPNNTQRLAIVGRTGSGKTQFAAWQLSLAPFNTQPYIIVDYKYDTLLNAIDRLVEIKLGDIPKYPGLYIVHPLPDEQDEMNAWLWKIWKKERVGLYFDEMYNVPDPQKRSALRAILTQGRSKRIPAFCLSQRPAWVSRFIFSEADFISCFHLNTEDDKARMRQITPFDFDAPLPQYHSRWYDVSAHSSFIVRPAPSADEILETFDERLKKSRRSI